MKKLVNLLLAGVLGFTAFFSLSPQIANATIYLLFAGNDIYSSKTGLSGEPIFQTFNLPYNFNVTSVKFGYQTGNGLAFTISIYRTTAGHIPTGSAIATMNYASATDYFYNNTVLSRDIPITATLNASTEYAVQVDPVSGGYVLWAGAGATPYGGFAGGLVSPVMMEVYGTPISAVVPSILLNPVALNSEPSTGRAYVAFNATLTSDGGEASLVKFYWQDVTRGTIWYLENPGVYYHTGDTIGFSLLETWEYGHSYAYYATATNSAGTTNTSILLASPSVVNGVPVAVTLSNQSFIYTGNTSATMRGLLISSGNTTTNTSFQYWTFNNTSLATGTVQTTDNTTTTMGSIVTKYVTGLNTSINYQYRFVAYNSYGNSTGAIGTLNWANTGSTVYSTVSPYVNGKTVQFNGLISNAGNLTGQYNFRYKLSSSSTWYQTPKKDYADNFTGYVAGNVSNLAPSNYVVEFMLYNTQYPEGVPPGGGQLTFIVPQYQTVNITTWKAVEVGIQADLYGNVTSVFPSAEVLFFYRPGGGGWDNWFITDRTTVTSNTSIVFRTIDLQRSTDYEYRIFAFMPDGSNVTGVVKTFHTLSGPAPNPDEPTPPIKPVEVPEKILKFLGMDSTKGHWLGLVLLLLVFSGAGIFFALKLDGLARSMAMIITGMLDLGVVGWFVFGGLLDTLAVMLLVIIGVILLIFLGNRVVAR